MKKETQKIGIITLLLTIIFVIPAITLGDGGVHDVHTALNATAITDTTAILSGSAIAIPSAGSVTPVYGYFRYSTATVPPIFCNETFGDNMKSTVDVKIDSNAAVGTRKTFTTDISGLDPNTTYYYCAVASDKSIIEYGLISSFTTANDPNVSLSSITTKPATTMSSNSAYLNGTYNSSVASTTWFEYKKKHTYQDIVNTVATLAPSVSLSTSLFPTGTFLAATNSNLNISPTNNFTSGMSANLNTLGSSNISISNSGLTPSAIKPAANPYNWSGKINSQTHIAGSSGTMSYWLKNLEKNTTYEFRAAIQTNPTGNNPQTTYGTTLSFRTSSSSVSDGDVDYNHGNTETNSGDDNLSLGDTSTPPDDAVVHYHEGIEHVLVRQLMRDYNRELIEMLGYQDSMNLETFAWDTADFLARTFGYVSPSGKEIRVGPPDMAAYRLIMKDGKLTVYEYFDSKIVAIQDITSSLRKSFEYEYYFTKKQ
jgi:hypothetical protein